MALVGLPFAAGMPPHVAQVPMAMTAAAPGARRSSHSMLVTWRPLSGVLTEAHPVALAGGGLVHDRALPRDDVGRVELTPLGHDEVVHPFRTGLDRQQGVDQLDARDAGDGSGEQLLQPGVGTAGGRHGAALTRRPGQPDQVDLAQRADLEWIGTGSAGGGGAPHGDRRQNVGWTRRMHRERFGTRPTAL